MENRKAIIYVYSSFEGIRQHKTYFLTKKSRIITTINKIEYTFSH